MSAEIIETFIGLRTAEIAGEKEARAKARRMQVLADGMKKPKAHSTAV